MRNLKNQLFVLLSFVLLIGCSDDDDNGTVNTANVVLRSTNNFGNIITDADGETLYFFSPDHTGTTSNCTGECLDAWPIFYEENISVGSGLDSDDFATITHPNGERQTTYKGWPLYYYAQDANTGDINGDGLGNVWFVAKPDYDVMYVSAQLVGRNNNGDESNLIIEDISTNSYVEGNGNTFYIVDGSGRTMYGFINDTFENNNYTAEDFSNNSLWPIVEFSVDTAPSVLDTNDFGTINVFGRTQLTYKGWPLYYFEQDENRGDNYGVGFPSPGVWPIVNPTIPTLAE